jgi:hypothetical protein
MTHRERPLIPTNRVPANKVIYPFHGETLDGGGSGGNDCLVPGSDRVLGFFDDDACRTDRGSEAGADLLIDL